MNRKTGLQRISEHVWIMPFDSPKDRPNLGYILGSGMALAVDAGHSSSHVEEFYDAIREEGLPLPALTVITHWHWDHTYGMHAVNGKTLARPETNARLLEIKREMDRDPGKIQEFINSDPTIRREYAGEVPVVVVPADEIVREDRTIDLRGVTAEIMLSPSPHTDDALLVYVPEDRVLFVRRYFFAESVAQLAAMTHASANRTSVRLFRLREKLRNYLQKEGLSE